ncbi:MAG TPA: hypothetical protein PK668_03790 [Myxococcota bacterium]|nr:hypothetical protein [Myxococcota bacterium]HRY91979.1 hypothetical protein [Myxococcota bacterium]HSA21367.1 hypothetical protein [Myxococcota bacterium]
MRRAHLWIVSLVLVGLAGPQASGQVPAQELLSLARGVQARVETLRGLKARRAIRFELADAERVRAYVKRAMDEQYAPGEFAREGLAMQALGLIPRGLDYPGLILELLQEQVGGYYDPKGEVFYLAAWMSAGTQAPIIAHELTHALQDQSFDLDAYQERLRGRSDAMLARAAVAEGDASLVMLLDSVSALGLDIEPAALGLDGPMADLLVQASAGQYPALARAPRALREALMFPYIQGMAFVSAVRARGGWKAVDGLYRRLPESSEQIMHPERYLDSPDPPTAVSLRALEELVPEGWETIFEDELGEAMSLQLLAAWGADDGTARQAAAGWDGDRFRAYQRGAELGWAGLWVWDTETDAVEFAAAAAQELPLRWPGATPEPVDARPRMAWRLADGRASAVVRAGSRVALVDGLPPAAVEKLLGALLP